MAAKKTAVSKSDFIRQQPSALSAADIVEKAKEAGMKILPALVYKVRARGRTKKGGVKNTPPPPTRNVASKPPVTASKADFVRAHASLSPKEVVAKAKAEGVKFDVGYVYNVRGADKAAAKKKRAARKASTAATTNGTQPSIPATSSRSEDLLRAVAAEIGLGRAIELLQGERARVHSILRR